MKKYKEVIDELNASGLEKNVLLCNGFNLSLKIKTDYPSIFDEMANIKEEYSDKDVKKWFTDECNGDIEKFLQKIENAINDAKLQPDIPKLKVLCSKNNKGQVSADFKQALNQIVSKHIAKIYKKKTRPILDFLKEYDNYCTLNYDSFLYLLLMRLKSDKFIFLSPPKKPKQAKPQIALLDSEWEKVEKIIDECQVRLNNNQSIKLRDIAVIDEIFRERKTKNKIEAIVKLFLSDAIKNKYCESDFVNIIKKSLAKEKTETNSNEEKPWVSDGFHGSKYERHKTYKYERHKTYLPGCKHTNKIIYLYYLHGALHLYGAKDKIQKIVSDSNTSFTKKVTEMIKDNDIQHDITIFEGDRQSKEKKIEKNPYLTDCLNALKNIEGNLVIIGSSFANNDKHIFGAINDNDNVKNVYISNAKDVKDRTRHEEVAKEFFSQKEREFFDGESLPWCDKSEKPIKSNENQ